MPITLRGPRKAMRGKCERGQGSANADGAGAKVFAGDGCSQGRLSAPWPRFHGVDRADVYIIIHVRACCCGECALNPPPSQFTPRRRPPLAPTQRHAFPEHFRSPTQRHAFPEHFRSPTQPRRTPAGYAMHARRPHHPFPAEALRSPTQRHALPEHLRSPTQPRRTPAGCAMHSPPTAQPFPRSATLPLLPFRFGHKKTAPHSACAMPNVSVDRRCGRSFGLVSRALFAAVAGHVACRRGA